MKRKKINPQRLSRIITSRECVSAQEHLINLYNELSSSQRQEIKDLFTSNKNKNVYEI